MSPSAHSSASVFFSQNMSVLRFIQAIMYCFLLFCWIIFHCTNMPQFFYPFSTDENFGYFQSLAIMHRKWMEKWNSFAGLFIDTCFYFSWVSNREWSSWNQEMTTQISLVSFSLVIRNFKIYSLSNFPICNKISLTMGTMLYITSPWLIYFITRSLGPLISFTHFAHPNVEFWEFLHIFCQVCGLQIFSPSLTHVFQPLNWVFHIAKVLILMKSSLSAFFYYEVCFDVMSKNSPNPRFWRSPMFSHKSFISYI